MLKALFKLTLIIGLFQLSYPSGAVLFVDLAGKNQVRFQSQKEEKFCNEKQDIVDKVDIKSNHKEDSYENH